MLEYSYNKEQKQNTKKQYVFIVKIAKQHNYSLRLKSYSYGIIAYSEKGKKAIKIAKNLINLVPI